MGSSNFGKWFIYVGLGLVVIGVLIWLGSKMGIPFGKLPGDIHVQKEKFSFYFPIATSIIVSIVLTILINLIFWFLRK
jgi:heme/copper-type cytochrome/quinol oxidase subunit 2